MTKNVNDISDQEAEKVAKTPNRITIESIRANVAKTEYFYSDTLTICVMTHLNGFKVIGESACADPANYNKELGDKLAAADAERKFWPLEAFGLREVMTGRLFPF